MDALYTTEIINIDGTNGSVSSKEGHHFDVSSPLSQEREGLNPEQFMGMAWSTCLNATLISLLKGRSMDHLKSKVRVEVSMCKEPEMSGYYFTMDAFVSIDTLEHDAVLKLAHQADKYCPVSKLIQANPHVAIHVEDYVA